VKPLDKVIDEVAKLENKKNPIFFVDDNIFIDKKRTIELMKQLKKYNVTWWSQTDIKTVQNEAFLDLAKECGCINLVIGFESLSEKSVTAVSKFQNKVGDYEETIQKLHKHGIFINPSFTFGVDGDYEDVFENTFSFLSKNGVVFATFNILTPLPGTQLFTQMKEQGRIIDTNWANYDMGHVVFQPRNISPEALHEGYEWICKKFYSLEEIYKRIKNLRDKKDIFDLNLVLGWNLGYKRMLDTFGVIM